MAVNREPAPVPVLRNAWSASTLLSGINHMDNDMLKCIKTELPDNPEDLQKLEEAYYQKHSMRWFSLTCLYTPMHFWICKQALTNMVSVVKQHSEDRPEKFRKSNSQATTIPATEEELNAMKSKAYLVEKVVHVIVSY